MERKLAISKSGHDKGSLYVIVREEEELVYLADGRLKTLEKPKKKNKKHIQPILNLPDKVAALLQGSELRNEEIKRAIRLYQKAEDAVS